MSTVANTKSLKSNVNDKSKSVSIDVKNLGKGIPSMTTSDKKNVKPKSMDLDIKGGDKSKSIDADALLRKQLVAALKDGSSLAGKTLASMRQKKQ